MWLEKSLFTILVSLILYLIIFIHLKKNKYSLQSIFGITLLYFYGIIVFHVTILPLPLDKLGVESLQMMATNRNYINLIPIIDFIEYDKYSFIKQVIGNIFMFMPLGILFPLVFKKCNNIKILIKYSFFISLFIEILQLVICLFLIKAPFRVFDINDLILNTFGAILGYILYFSIKVIIDKR
jgi:glycopeptide antibiotics resistance protein